MQREGIIIQLCDECHARVGTCNCYDWEEQEEEE